MNQKDGWVAETPLITLQIDGWNLMPPHVILLARQLLLQGASGVATLGFFLQVLEKEQSTSGLGPERTLK